MPFPSPSEATRPAAVDGDRTDGHEPVARPASRPRSIGFVDGLLRRGVFGRLEQLRDGRIVLEEGGGRRAFGRDGGASRLAATVHVRDPRFYRQLALGGSLGAAEAFIRGHWDCDDLVSLVRIFCRNPAVSGGVDRGLARLGSPLRRLAHRLRRNTTRGSRRNIAAHYDLGNEFFAVCITVIGLLGSGLDGYGQDTGLAPEV